MLVGNDSIVVRKWGSAPPVTQREDGQMVDDLHAVLLTRRLPSRPCTALPLRGEPRPSWGSEPRPGGRGTRELPQANERGPKAGRTSLGA